MLQSIDGGSWYENFWLLLELRNINECLERDKTSQKVNSERQVNICFNTNSIKFSSVQNLLTFAAVVKSTRKSLR